MEQPTISTKRDINQRPATNRFFVTHKYSCNVEYEGVNSIDIQLPLFIRTEYNSD